MSRTFGSSNGARKRMSALGQQLTSKTTVGLKNEVGGPKTGAVWMAQSSKSDQSNAKESTPSDTTCVRAFHRDGYAAIQDQLE